MDTVVDRILTAAVWVAALGASNVVVGVLVAASGKSAGAQPTRSLGESVAATGILNLLGAVVILSVGLTISLGHKIFS